jgi:hypothetical protein
MIIIRKEFAVVVQPDGTKLRLVNRVKKIQSTDNSWLECVARMANSLGHSFVVGYETFDRPLYWVREYRVDIKGVHRPMKYAPFITFDHARGVEYSHLSRRY